MPDVQTQADAAPAANATLERGDGSPAERIALALEGGRLRLTDPAGRVERVALDRLARDHIAAGAGRRLVLRQRGRAGWLLRPDEVQGWMTALPRVRPPGLQRRNLGIIAALAGVAVALWAWGGALLAAGAPLLPRSWTEPLGEAVAADAGADRRCAAPAGVEALDALVARVRPQTLNVRVRVAPLKSVNAFAAPGGLVVLHDGLIRSAASPEEVAGVLAHELAHVELMHPEQALLRHFGGSLVMGALLGDVGSVVDTGLVLARSRAAERAADARGAAILAQARIPVAPLADFLTRLERQERLEAPARASEGTGAPEGTGKPGPGGAPDRAGGAQGNRPAGSTAPADARAKAEPSGPVDRALDTLGGYLASHPGTEERVAALRAAPAPASTEPVLSAAQWRALRAICTQVRDRAGRPVVPAGGKPQGGRSG